MSTLDIIGMNGARVDLSPRVFNTTSIVGSPALAAETTVASLSVSSNVVTASGVYLFAYCAFTVGTSGVSATLKIHHTNSSGATLGTTGAVTVVAANLYAPSVMGFDASPVLPNQTYIATLTIGSGAAASTVSAVQLVAIVV
jgi:hypothetical protein